MCKTFKTLTQVLSEFGLQADLKQLVLVQDAVILTHKPETTKTSVFSDYTLHKCTLNSK